MKDVTAKVESGQALPESQHFIERIANATPGFLYIYDLLEQRLIYANGRSIDHLGYSLQELQKSGPEIAASLLHPEDRDKIYEHQRELVAAGDDEIIEVEYRVRDNQGKWRRFHSRDVVFHRAADGSPVQILGVAVDIHERWHSQNALKQAALELARTNSELEQFVYIVSHDLQEPLRMVTGYLGLLAERYKDRLDEDANDFIDYAVDGANWMFRLINDLLHYSRVTTHGKPFEKISAEKLLEQALAILQVTIRENQAIITSDSLPVIMADKVQMVQLFQNLVGNAIKFRSEKRPEISIRVERRQDEWLFSVQDNGIGLDPRQADRIFLIFQRLHTRDEYPGTGIGLALCKKIVERHGGRIWVESRPGQGARFFFTIPIQGEEK